MAKSRCYVIGDLHGAYKALKDVLFKFNFDYENDKLIFIGDLADGWGEFDKCLDVFKKIKNFIPILGNHDLFLKRYVLHNEVDKRWLSLGGKKTIDKINKNPKIFLDLMDYFDKAVYYHIHDNKLFCHGGLNHKRALDCQKQIGFALNRKMYRIAGKYEKQGLTFKIKRSKKDTSDDIKEIFIGHSTTKDFKPSFRSNLINVDTGAGSFGHLTIMNVDTKAYIQSKKVQKYYNKVKR